MDGTKICYRRAQEPDCRPGVIAGNLEDTDRGMFALIHYGAARGSDSKTTFETTRRLEPGGAPDTWHEATACPFDRDKRCPYPDVAGAAPETLVERPRRDSRPPRGFRPPDPMEPPPADDPRKSQGAADVQAP